MFLLIQDLIILDVSELMLVVKILYAFFPLKTDGIYELDDLRVCLEQLHHLKLDSWSPGASFSLIELSSRNIGFRCTQFTR